MSKTNQHRFFSLGALLGIVALTSVAGCGEGTIEPTASAMYALTGHVAGPYGSTIGTIQGPASDLVTPVTKIVGYSSSAYVYGIQLYWGSTSVLYGQTGGATGDTIDLTDDPVNSVKYVISSGVLRGIRFQTVDGRVLELGLSPASSVAFSSSNALLTDMQIWQGTVYPNTVIKAAKFYYTTP